MISCARRKNMKGLWKFYEKTENEKPKNTIKFGKKSIKKLMLNKKLTKNIREEKKIK